MIAEWFSSSWSGLGAELGNHLWQSTLFALVAGLLTVALRKNQARARYWLWLAASLKFLIPFSLLIGIGSDLAWFSGSAVSSPTLSLAMERVSQPFAAPTVEMMAPMAQSASSGATASALGDALVHWLPAVLGVVWLCGFAAVLAVWGMGWRRVAATKREAVRLREGREVEALRRLEDEAEMRNRIPILLSKGIEPGIFGIFRSVLLWPEGISARLDDAQMEAILAHELSHVRRRDNLAAALHLLVEATFWFYPVVWWMGSRLVAEREQACDEEVVQRGKTQQAYAEGILKVCQFCVEGPAACVAGVTSADLKKRIARIMRRGLGERLTVGRKLLLGAAALAAIGAPVVFGLAAAQQGAAPPLIQEAEKFGPEFKYTVVSIKLNTSGSSRIRGRATLPDGLDDRNFQVITFFLGMQYAPRMLLSRDQIIGVPDWFYSDRYDVEARMDPSVADELQKMDPAQQWLARQHMMLELLEDRFKLRVHWEMRPFPVYFLTVAKNGFKIKQAPAGEAYPTIGRRKTSLEGLTMGSPGEATFYGVSMDRVAARLPALDGRHIVNRTGLKGNYDFTLHWAPTAAEFYPGCCGSLASPSSGPTGTGPAFSAGEPSKYPALPKALEEQLGLKLVPGTAPLPVVVIDHVEKPSEN